MWMAGSVKSWVGLQNLQIQPDPHQTFQLLEHKKAASAAFLLVVVWLSADQAFTQSAK